MPKPQGPPIVRFEIDTVDLPFQRFLDMGGELIAVLREVEHEVAPDAQMRWIIDTISKASPLAIGLRPVPQRPRTPIYVPRTLVRTVNAGIRDVQRRAERPAHFSNKALEKAKALVETATAGGAIVKIGTAKSPVRVDARLIRNVDTILGATVSAIGTVEGTLEAFNVHGNARYFNIYDSLTDEKIRCDFGHRIPVSAIGAAAERRVAVHGEIKYRETGETVNVLAYTMEVFPLEDELPSADAVRGILAD